jgi:Tol biopolymer transport system component
MRPRRRVATAVDRLRIAPIGYVRVMSRLKATLAISTFVVAAAFPLAFAHAASPGKNGRLALEGDTKLGIYTVKPSGKDLTRITPKLPFAFEPSFSPNGKWIAFERDGKLLKMRADGSHLTKLAKYSGGGGINQCISWAPDNKSLLYDRDDDIWTVKANGRGAKRIIPGPTFQDCPSYAPNGKRFVFCRNDPNGGGINLVIADADGSNAQILMTPNGGTAFGPTEPDWSPNGKRIAFIATGGGGADIASIKTNGTGFKVIVGTNKIEVDPAYSPDGKQIAYAALINEDTTYIRRAPVAGGPSKNITPKSQHWFNPSWQPR